MPLTETERDILVDLLVYRDDKASNIGRRTAHHRNSVSRLLKNSLSEGGYVKDKGDGAYRLTDKGLEKAQSLLRGGYSAYTDD